MRALCITASRPSPVPIRACWSSAACRASVSLQQQRYYAHPQNLFWRLMSAVIGRELVPLGYEDRLQALLDAGIGLWDTVAAATREGSLDADIRLHEASDLGTLMATLPATPRHRLQRRDLGADRPPPACRGACSSACADRPPLLQPRLCKPLLREQARGLASPGCLSLTAEGEHAFGNSGRPMIRSGMQVSARL